MQKIVCEPLIAGRFVVYERGALGLFVTVDVAPSLLILRNGTHGFAALFVEREEAVVEVPGRKSTSCSIGLRMSLWL